jgi:hypothetical protein
MRLQWTHRLKDYLAREKYCVEERSAHSLRSMNEVELVYEEPIADAQPAPGYVELLGDGGETGTTPSATRKRKAPAKSENGSKVLNNSTPQGHHHIEPVAVVNDHPSFEQFSGCYQKQRSYVILMKTSKKSDILASSGGRHAAHAGTSFDALRGDGTQVSVIWFSDTVFMSSVWFGKRGGKVFSDYHIDLLPRHEKTAIRFFVYSILNFAKAKLRQKPVPSLTPITFLASMTSRLPADFLEAINFMWHRDDCPQPAFEVLSIVPLPAPRSNSDDKLTKVIFHSELSPHLIGAALENCEAISSSVRYNFNFSLNEGLNTTLRESPHLRHVHIPTHFLKHGCADEVPFTENGHIESVTVDFYVGEGLNLLGSASRSCSLKRLYVRVLYQQYQAFVNGYSYLLNEALSGVSNLQEIKILFTCRKRTELDSFFRALDLNCVTGRSTLSHVSIMTGDWNGEQNWFDVRNGIRSSDLWDRVVSPRLAMNWYSSLGKEAMKEGSQQIEEGSCRKLVSYKARAVNLGIVYRKTTYHVPHDPHGIRVSTANACLLFALLRDEYCS